MATPSTNGCVKCCCERIALKPGTTTKVSLGYAPWAVPIVTAREPSPKRLAVLALRTIASA